MGKKARSARGVTVDFDLMKIKSQIASAPTPIEVRARQDFIENRLRRRIKKAQNVVDEAKNISKPVMPEPAATLDESYIEDDVKEPVEALIAIDEAIKEVKNPATKQVARSKKIIKDTE